MHKLTRQVRFSVNPFLQDGTEGFNSYASKPAGEGLAVFLELSVEVAGDLDPETGFVINVTDIDKNARAFAVPLFAERIKQDFHRGKHISLSSLAGLLVSSWNQLTDKFVPAKLSRLSLKLNPYRKISISSEDPDMLCFCEKFEFAATHKLWNDEFSEERNFEAFGKCANPTGHGHNYIVEVEIKMPAREAGFRIGDFEKIVDREFIELVDHKNLNTDVEQFGKINPTVENIASFAWSRLTDKFGPANLHRITIWETDKTYCSYCG